MKKRIGTKLYDTEKSTYIGITSDGKQLYQKRGRSRDFFAISGGNGVVDISEEQVREYIQSMEIVNEPRLETPERCVISVDAQTHLKLKILAAKMGESISEVLRDLMDGVDDF